MFSDRASCGQTCPNHGSLQATLMVIIKTLVIRQTLHLSCKLYPVVYAFILSTVVTAFYWRCEKRINLLWHLLLFLLLFYYFYIIFSVRVNKTHNLLVLDISIASKYAKVIVRFLIVGSENKKAHQLVGPCETQQRIPEWLLLQIDKYLLSLGGRGVTTKIRPRHSN